MAARRILVVSASAGSGHVRAGDALVAGFHAAGVAAEHVDVLELAPRWVRAAYAGGFALVASRAPRIWGEIYRRSDGPDGDAARWGGVAARLLFRTFRARLIDGRFDACVCTHFLPGQLAAGRAGLPPFTTVVTDFALHRYWVQPRVVSYYVASRAMADELKRRHPRATVAATGIPVAEAFAAPLEQRTARASLRLDPDRPVVLVMGGSIGLGVEAAATAVLAARTPGLQVLAVCGRNEGARHRLTDTAARATGALHVAGYTKDIVRCMSAADLIVTKPGGLTTSEALALGRPLLLTPGMPGHEAANVRYLTAAGAAIEAPTGAAVTSGVEQFFADTSLRRSLRAAAALVAAPHAADAIVQGVLAQTARRAVA